MAFKHIIVSVLLAAIAHGHPETDDDEGFSPNMVFRYVDSLLPPNPPAFPRGFPRPPPLMSPPPLFMYLPEELPTIHFPPMPTFPPPPQFPTVEEIASENPNPDGSFDAVFISSKSVGTRDEDGKIRRKGGATVITNDNGEVTVEKMGDSPPEVIITKEPPFPNLPKFKSHPMPHFKPVLPHIKQPKLFPGFQPFPSFELPIFEHKHFDFDAMKNYVPEAGEHYTSSVVSSHAHSTNINGVKSSGGSVSAMTNVDGDVDEQKLAFEKADPKP